MRTAGIDLAASPGNTAACEVDWAAGTITLWPAPVDDGALVALAGRADLTGIDVPLGWPDGFVAAVAAHHRGEPWPPSEQVPPADRVPLRFRRTDVHLQGLGHRPLSVSTDLIGVAALRGARLQGLLVEAGVVVDRSGVAGDVAEVYPAAALRVWGLTSRGYKGQRGAELCRALAGQLAEGCGDLRPQVAAALEGCDDHGLDALVCAVVARAVLQGQTGRPAGPDLAVARREGWIHVPEVDLGAVVGA